MHATAASSCTLQQFLDKDFWATICPKLHLESSKFTKNSKTFQLKDTIPDIKQQVDTQGVVQVPSSQLPWRTSCEVMAEAVRQLREAGWPASFVLLYDEIWDMVHCMSNAMSKATGNACNMDILAWYVDPNSGEAGFSPHRDRQPDDSPATFRPDGSAMYTTCWVALTDACPENSCLYVIPRPHDPGYFVGDDDDGPDVMDVALSSKEAYQHIRALPAPAGSAVIFTHRIIHWGSRGRVGYPTPRISMSFGCADDAFEPPYFSRSHLPFPPFQLRVALASAQMIVYHERFEMSSAQLAMFHKAFMAQAGEFDAGYKAIVLKEFVAASKEAVDRAAAKQLPPPTLQLPLAAVTGKLPKTKAKVKSGEELEGKVVKKAKKAKDKKSTSLGKSTVGVPVDAHDDDDDDDVLDTALDAMLDAKLAGQDDFDDDFDDEVDDYGDGLEEEEEEEEEEGGLFPLAGSDDDDDVLDTALDAMLDAKMAGQDDFEDDFNDDFNEGLAQDDSSEGDENERVLPPRKGVKGGGMMGRLGKEVKVGKGKAKAGNGVVKKRMRGSGNGGRRFDESESEEECDIMDLFMNPAKHATKIRELEEMLGKGGKKEKVEKARSKDVVGGKLTGVAKTGKKDKVKKLGKKSR